MKKISNFNTINIESINDLHKIPLKVLKSTKIYNFKGKYYEKLYQEALELEQKEFEKQPMIKFVYTKAPTNTLFEEVSDNNLLEKSNCFKKYKNNDENPNDNIKVPNISDLKRNSLEINILNENIESINSIRGNSCHISKKKKNEHKIKKITFQIQYNTKIGEDIGLLGSIKELGQWAQKNALRMYWNKGNIWKTTIDISFTEINSFEYKFALFSNGNIIEWESGDNRLFNLSDIQKSIKRNIKNKKNTQLNTICEDDYEYNMKDHTLILKCAWNKN